ncbi:hypothetical protein CVT25_004415 [Psilocybe cyanescens]|uniref:Lactam utilization protein lamB n=1 Tax=Psilocybe cyanescens TaxID=93625 RepID=A0A409XW02_PSICY|nr:hypothetical protein CVT25_004415 [Psilocybe cyanescens]
MVTPLKATVNCDMGEGFSLYKIGDDEGLMSHIHLANIACGFHASDFSVMNTTVALAKKHGVAVGAHPSLPDLQGFGRREMAVEPIKPHGAVYGQTSRSLPLARAVVEVAKIFSTPNEQVSFVGIAGSAHQIAAEEMGIRFIPEWFADMDYSAEGKLLITKKHDPVPLDVVRERVSTLLTKKQITTLGGGFVPLGDNVDEVTICCHSDTPVESQILFSKVPILTKF